MPPRPPTSLPQAAPAHRKGAHEPAGAFRVAGVDEAGRGPWAGPVVAAAVMLRRTRLPVRVDDSKRLTRLQRERAFEVILEHAEVGFGIVSAEEIDRRNIHHATLLAMREAVRDLRSAPTLVLVDGAFLPPITAHGLSVVRGDAHCYPISCASIMAKVLRDSLMRFYHTLHPGYAFDRHQGYGTPVHACRLRALGPCLLHRRSFRPVADALAAAVRRAGSQEGRPDAAVEFIAQPA